MEGRKVCPTLTGGKIVTIGFRWWCTYFFIYLFLRHQVARKHAWKGFIQMWIQTWFGSFLHFGNNQTAFEGKNRIQLCEDWHSRQETVESFRLNPSVCKLLRFPFNFTMKIYVASSWNLCTYLSNSSLKLQALKSRDDMRVSSSTTNKIEACLMIIKVMLNVNKVQV